MARTHETPVGDPRADFWSGTVELPDGREVSLADLPIVSVRNLFDRGMTHLAGNVAASELAAKIKAAVAKAAGTNGEGKPLMLASKVSGSSPEYRAFVEENDDTLEVWKLEIAERQASAIMAGELGTVERGGATSERQAAEATMKAVYAKNNVKWPTGKGCREVIGKIVDAFLANHQTAKIPEGLRVRFGDMFAEKLAEIRAARRAPKATAESAGTLDDIAA